MDVNVSEECGSIAQIDRWISSVRRIGGKSATLEVAGPFYTDAASNHFSSKSWETSDATEIADFEKSEKSAMGTGRHFFNYLAHHTLASMLASSSMAYPRQNIQ